MALKLGDRIKESTSTSGTGTISLGGAVAGFAAFSTVLSNTDTCYYTIIEGNNWEVGLGTYASSGNTLARSVLQSSNSDNAITLGGSAEVFITIPADKAIVLDASGNLVLSGDLTVSGDDITLGTNTSGHVMVADGTNYNPVAISGDVSISSSGAVTLSNTAITSKTALASGLADTDEILISDGGTIKRTDVSVLREVTDASATALAIALG